MSPSVLNLSFSWQADGRIAATTDSGGSGRGASYSYTPSGRAQGASGPWGSYAYAWDGAGNQTQAGPSATPVTATLDSLSNRVTSTAQGGATQRTLAYSPGGLMTSDAHAGGTNYVLSYNAARRLSGSHVGFYAYDFRGQRVWRHTQGGGTGAETAYVYDENGHLLAEHNLVNGVMQREYVWVDDTPIAMVYFSGGVTSIAYIHTGQIGEPLAMTSASQALLWNGYVDPFGAAGTFATPTVSLGQPSVTLG